MAIDIRKFTYKIRCDINGCKNLADVSIGDERHPYNLRHNFCNECLQQIILAAPQEMITKRADIMEIVDMLSDKPEEEIEGNIDYENMSMQQLRKIARDKGHPVPVGSTKEEAVILVKNLSNWEG